jgi:uncharacterized ferritin-like protein (DUF455 family)
MNFYETLHTVLIAPNPKEKIAHFKDFYKLFLEDSLSFTTQEEPLPLSHPSYENYCTVVSPQKVPRRKNLQSDEGQIALLHAVVHIEYSAIDLALDAAYRFRGLPKEYYADWLAVAEDEVRHFEMLEALLLELGSFYGDLPVHNALFEAQERTAHSLLHRMAVVPRYLEANGLDATPQILQKLKRLPHHTMLSKIMAALEIIVEEEIDHVKKGDHWFSYACQLEGVSKALYFEIIEQYYPDTFSKVRHINVAGRKASGFTCSELKRIASQEVCE